MTTFRTTIQKCYSKDLASKIRTRSSTVFASAQMAGCTARREAPSQVSSKSLAAKSRQYARWASSFGVIIQSSTSTKSSQKAEATRLVVRSIPRAAFIPATTAAILVVFTMCRAATIAKVLVSTVRCQIRIPSASSKTSGITASRDSRTTSSSMKRTHCRSDFADSYLASNRCRGRLS